MVTFQHISSGPEVNVACNENLPVTLNPGQSKTFTFNIPASNEPNGTFSLFDFVETSTSSRTGTTSTVSFNQVGGPGLGPVPNPNATISYTINQANDGNSTQVTDFHLEVYPHNLPQLAIYPNSNSSSQTVCQGKPLSLNWTAYDIASATLTDGAGNVTTLIVSSGVSDGAGSYHTSSYPTEAEWNNGSSCQLGAVVYPAKNDTYTLTATGYGGETTTSSIQVAIIPFSVNIQVAKNPGLSADAYTLTWSSVGAGSVDLYVTPPGGTQTLIAPFGISQGAPPGYNYRNPSGAYDFPPSGSLVVTVQDGNSVYTATAYSSGACGSTSANAPLSVPYPSDSSQAVAALSVTTSLSSPHVPPAGGSGTSAALACLFLTRDAHRRPLAAGAGNGTPCAGYFSNDAGHSFGRSVLDADATCADVSLLIDRHVSRFSAFYTKGKPGSQALYAAFGPVVDEFPPDAAPAAARGISGLYPVACEHPAERGAALLLLVQGKSLVCAETGDYGENWTQAGTVAAGVDFSASGRPGLCFLGGTAFAAYASGKQIACAKSEDRGKSWAACAPAGASGPYTSGPYSGVSLLGWQGTLYLLAFAAPASAGAAPVPALFISEVLGAAWTLSPSPLPKIGLPSALGVLPETGQIRLGLSHHSDDDAATWLAN